MFPIYIRENLKLELLRKYSILFHNFIEKNRTHLYDFLPRICDTKSVEQTSQVIENLMFQYQKGNGFKAGIFYDDTLIGIAGLKYADSINKKQI